MVNIYYLNLFHSKRFITQVYYAKFIFKQMVGSSNPRIEDEGKATFSLSPLALFLEATNGLYRSTGFAER